jgi:AcrR family transcriptional regulator
MMRKVELKKQQIVLQVAHYLMQEGFLNTGLRTLARVAQTSDRMLIYYFESKEALIGEALQSLAEGLVSQLDCIVGTHERSGAALLQELLSASHEEGFKPILQLWFEIVGLAMRGQEPYAEITRGIANHWLDWTRSRLYEVDKANALSLFGQLEGLLMLHLIGLETE